MTRRQAKVGPAQRLTGYGILAALALITLGLLVQQARFNPAVSVALRAPLQGRLQAVAGQTPAATAALIPEAEGFTPQAPAESFSRETLSDKIDGKAELYLSAGFKEMSCRSFSLGSATHVEVYLYDMGSPPNAYAVFSGQRRAGAASTPLTANAYSTANALFFTHGRFYVELVADRAAEGLPSSLEAYARALLAKLPAAGETKEKDPKALFPKEGLARDTLRLSPADTFGLEGLNDVFTGEYTLKSGKATAFVARRDVPDQARAEAKRYLDFLAANGYRKVETAGQPKGFQVLALDNSFEIVFVQDNTLAGVHDATSAAAALELAARLQAEFKGQL